MYETMVAWESLATSTEIPPVEQEFARIWVGLEKLVISTTLQEVSSAKTRIERSIDIAAIRRMKADATKGISVSGATLASAFIAAGLVDEIGVYVMPVVLGGGTPFFVNASGPLQLELIEEHRFQKGAMFLRYRLGHS